MSAHAVALALAGVNVVMGCYLAWLVCWRRWGPARHDSVAAVGGGIVAVLSSLTVVVTCLP